jgi:anti-sigma B factor antagonist
MEIIHRRLNRADVLALNGRLDAATAPLLKQHLDTLFAQRRYRIVLDLAGLEHMSSPGLHVLAEARKRAHDGTLAGIEGGDIRIANLSPRMKGVFDLVGFTSLFRIYPDVVEAVGSF